MIRWLHFGRGFLPNLYRLLRFGPALYATARKLGGSRWSALRIVVSP